MDENKFSKLNLSNNSKNLLNNKNNKEEQNNQKKLKFPTIIYCGVGNKNLDTLAVQNGFRYGLRLPKDNRAELEVFFADQNWKNPNKDKYIQSIEKHKPQVVTVLDLEREEQYNEVIEWANLISELEFIKIIIIIPKCLGVIEKIPRNIKDKEIRLGFSVPTNHGRTDLDTELFKDWEIHLLGGQPKNKCYMLKK